MRPVGALLVLALPALVFGFIPFAEPESLQIYPLWHEPSFSTAPCTLGILQPTIQLVCSDTAAGPIRESARVCSLELFRALCFAIDPAGVDPARPIREIRVLGASRVPDRPTGQDVQVVVVFGTRDDPLVNDALARVGLDARLVPGGDTVEGYLLGGQATTDPGLLLVVCAGASPVGCFRGASTLRELIAQHTGTVLPTRFQVRDWPDCSWREVGWSALEIGGDTLDRALIGQLDYLSLLKANLVNHVDHRRYFAPPGERTPADRTDAERIAMMRDTYVRACRGRGLAAWYPRYRQRGIEPVPVLANFSGCLYHVAEWNPNCIAGTSDSLRFVVGEDDTLRPLYRLLALANPSFEAGLLGWNARGAVTVDPTTAWAGRQSLRLCCTRDRSAALSQVVFAPGDRASGAIAYQVKSRAYGPGNARVGDGLIACLTAADHDRPLARAYAFAFDNGWKWRFRAEPRIEPLTIEQWCPVTLGLGSISRTVDRCRVDFIATLSDTSGLDSLVYWLDAEPVMGAAPDPVPLYTQAQRFLVETDRGGLQMFRGRTAIPRAGNYLIVHGGLSYDAGNGGLNTADPAHPNDDFRVVRMSGSVLQAGDTVTVRYNHITRADLKEWGWRFNYAPPLVEPVTGWYDTAAVHLITDQLAPRYIDHQYNEVAQNSLVRDGRTGGERADRLLATDLDYNLTWTRHWSADSTGRTPGIAVLADGLVPQHQGASTWTAIRILKERYPDDTSRIIPKLWGVSTAPGSRFAAWQNQVLSAISLLNGCGLTPALSPFDPSIYAGSLAALARARSSHRRCRGISWSGPARPTWTSRDAARGYRFLPWSMDFAWNSAADRLAWQAGQPAGVSTRYDPNILHQHRGDIFVPRVRFSRPPSHGFGSGPADPDSVVLHWTPSLNQDRSTYRIRRLNNGFVDQRDHAEAWTEVPCQTLGGACSTKTDAAVRPSYIRTAGAAVEAVAVYSLAAIDSLGNVSSWSCDSVAWRPARR